MRIDVIDCRGFVKTPPYNPYSGENLSGKNARRDLISGQGSINGLKVVAQPISPSIR